MFNATAADAQVGHVITAVANAPLSHLFDHFIGGEIVDVDRETHPSGEYAVLRLADNEVSFNRILRLPVDRAVALTA